MIRSDGVRLHLPCGAVNLVRPALLAMRAGQHQASRFLCDDPHTPAVEGVGGAVRMPVRAAFGQDFHRFHGRQGLHGAHGITGVKGRG